MERWSEMGRYSGSGYSMSIIPDETPQGVIDGVNATFTIATIPNPTTSLALFKNGQLLIQGVAYTLVGNTITVATPYIPQPATSNSIGDYLRAWYQIS